MGVDAAEVCLDEAVRDYFGVVSRDPIALEHTWSPGQLYSWSLGRDQWTVSVP